MKLKSTCNVWQTSKIRSITLFVRNALRRHSVLKIAFWQNQNDIEIKSIGTVAANIKIPLFLIANLNKNANDYKVHPLWLLTNFQCGKEFFDFLARHFHIIHFIDKVWPLKWFTLVFQQFAFDQFALSKFRQTIWIMAKDWVGEFDFW